VVYDKGPEALLPPALHFVLFLVSKVIIHVVLAVSAPPDTPVEIIEILPDDVDIGPIDYFLSCSDLAAVTTDELHGRSYSTLGKNGAHAAWSSGSRLNWS
jgi:hypothetical protein